MTLQKVSEDSTTAEVSVHGYIRGDDFPSSGINPLEPLLGSAWSERNIVLDFSKVTEMGSAGVGWLLMTHRTLKAKGMKVAVHSVKPLVMQQMMLMSVNRIVIIAEDRAKAFLALGAAGMDPVKGNP